MSDVADLTTCRARAIALGFMAAYQRQREVMRIAGVPSSELAAGDDGGTVVADLAACMMVVAALPRAGLSAAVLRRMSVVEAGAFAALDRAARAYFASEELRRGLGQRAAEPFRLLREALPGG